LPMRWSLLELVSISHAAWDVDAVHGMHPVYSASVPRCVGWSRPDGHDLMVTDLMITT
jgi:hypothetical protein